MSNLLQNTHSENQQVADLLHQLFVRLNPQDVEQFYASYHSWALQQHIEHLRKRMCTLYHQIAENMEQLQRVSPSPIASAALAQLQAHGIDDIDLLDRMLERGDTWIDHTLQLLEQCKRLNVIQGTYTQWCEHALEGAYDWVESIDDSHTPAHMLLTDEDSLRVADTEQVMPPPEVTEEQLLQKLMSEDETEKYPVLRPIAKPPKITRPLAEATSETTNMQPTSPEVIAVEKNHRAPIAIKEEIPAQHVTEVPAIAEKMPAATQAPITISKREEPMFMMRETKNKPQRQRSWLQRLLITIWQTIIS